MLNFLLAASLLLPVAPQQPDTDYEVIRVIDGRLLVGEILEHDLDGLVVQSARNGGTYRLSWGDLFPGEAERLKTGFGYRTSFETPTVSADRLLLVNGQQITGRILRRDSAEIEIRSRGVTTLVPTVRLAAPPEKVVVDADQVLTPEQFYAERLPQVGETGMAQFDFAQELEAVAAYEQALVHLQLAQALAQSEDDQALLSRVDGAIPRIRTAIEHRVETEKLRDIRTLIYRERFAEAEQLLQEFATEHSDSPVFEEYIKVAEKFEGQREEAMVRYLERNWYKRAASLLKKKSLDRKANVEQLQQFATGELPELMRETMAEELAPMKEDLTPSEVGRLWEARLETKPKRHQAGFGNGTWILGEARARAGLKEEEAEEEDGRSAAEKELQDRYKRYLDNLERSRRAAGTDTEQTPEDWWSNSSASSRFQWLLAFYAEYSGDFELVRVMFAQCTTCNGDGSVEILEVGGDNRPQRKKCPTCQGVTVRRSIFFR